MNARKVQNVPGESASQAQMTLRLEPSGIRWQPEGKAARLNFNSEQHSKDGAISNNRLVKRIADSALFRDFKRAFEDATRLPLTLRAVKSWQLAHTESRHQNGFCALMSRSNHSCASCLQAQQRVCEGVNGVPCTLNCTFGLVETSVGVKCGQDILAYLQTGQVFFKPPTSRQTQRALQQIKEWGLRLDAGEAARSYNATPVVRRREYEATMRLLQFFADQLGTLANQILLRQQTVEPGQITRARKFIEEQYREKLSLALVAPQAGMSTWQLCKMFKRSTGVNFAQYVSRIRVEHAKNLLSNPNYRVTEISYEVGFQSLTSFSRAFRTIAGESPKEYRAHLPIG
jgi:AraC-like DNA-binding protein